MNTSQIVVADDILEDLFCHKCCRYLNVAPILVSSLGGYICGRCHVNDKRKDASTPLFILTDSISKYEQQQIIPIILFRFVSQGCLFPCVNRFDGCKKLLQFSEVISHEKKCPTEENPCPYECRFCGVGSQMIRHFQETHRKFSVNQIKLNMNLKSDFSDVRLYRKRNLLAFVKIRFFWDTKHVSVKTRFIGSEVGSARVRLLFRTHFISRWFRMGSERLAIAKNNAYVISFKLDDRHFCDAKIVTCVYEIVTE